MRRRARLCRRRQFRRGNPRRRQGVGADASFPFPRLARGSPGLLSHRSPRNILPTGAQTEGTGGILDAPLSRVCEKQAAGVIRARGNRQSRGHRQRPITGERRLPHLRLFGEPSLQRLESADFHHGGRRLCALSNHHFQFHRGDRGSSRRHDPRLRDFPLPFQTLAGKAHFRGQAISAVTAIFRHRTVRLRLYKRHDAVYAERGKAVQGTRAWCRLLSSKISSAATFTPGTWRN